MPQATDAAILKPLLDFFIKRREHLPDRQVEIRQPFSGMRLLRFARNNVQLCPVGFH